MTYLAAAASFARRRRIHQPPAAATPSSIQVLGSGTAVGVHIRLTPEPLSNVENEPSAAHDVLLMSKGPTEVVMPIPVTSITSSQIWLELQKAFAVGPVVEPPNVIAKSAPAAMFSAPLSSTN